jgi:hypothetical protein
MNRAQLYFVSRNPHKQHETRKKPQPIGITAMFKYITINELQIIKTGPRHATR